MKFLEHGLTLSRFDIEIVLNTSRFYKLTEYEKCLKMIYPKELLEKYETVLKEHGQPGVGPETLSGNGEYFKRMQKYPQGKEKVKEIVILPVN